MCFFQQLFKWLGWIFFLLYIEKRADRKFLAESVSLCRQIVQSFQTKMLSFRLIVLIGLSSKGVFSDSCYQTPGLHSVYIKSIQCKFTDKYIYPNSTCYAKSFNRTCSTVTIKLITKSPLSNVFVSYRSTIVRSTHTWITRKSIINYDIFLKTQVESSTLL